MAERQRPRRERVECPVCHEEFDPRHSEDLPFCSFRCKAVDLHQWLDGSYQPPSWEEDEEEYEG